MVKVVKKNSKLESLSEKALGIKKIAGEKLKDLQEIPTYLIYESGKVVVDIQKNIIDVSNKDYLNRGKQLADRFELSEDVGGDWIVRY